MASRFIASGRCLHPQEPRRRKTPNWVGGFRAWSSWRWKPLARRISAWVSYVRLIPKSAEYKAGIDRAREGLAGAARERDVTGVHVSAMEL
jgi:hypothetical protein